MTTGHTLPRTVQSRCDFQNANADQHSGLNDRQVQHRKYDENKFRLEAGEKVGGEEQEDDAREGLRKERKMGWDWGSKKREQG